jgi:spore coat polysaccharide biosynthesis predicted glycosyltransferase SpsG
MKIAIISDGNNELGMGHIYQSITLYNLLKDSNVPEEIFFITKSESHVVKLLKTTEGAVFQCKNDDEIFELLKEKQVSKVIFDKLDVSPNLALSIKKELKKKLIILTNLTEANKYADVTVLADIGSNFKNIYKIDKTNGKVEFFGPKYWLLRPEFYKYKKLTNEYNIENVLLIFGGADPCNYSTLVLNELLKSKFKLNITLILGSAFNNEKELNETLKLHEKSNSKVKIEKSVSNVAEKMFTSDLVFASPGLSFFESLVVGTPVIVFHQNSMQKDVYNGYIKTYGKNDVDKTELFLDSKNFISPNDPFIKEMEIGRGKDEIVLEILKN